MENKTYWNKLKTPPPSSLKNIHGGRLKGMTDINPQWRLEAMTEVFGPCGVGWKYSIDKLWTEQGNGDEVLAFALVSVQIFDGEKWSEPIPGIGGNKLISVEQRGPHNNDEAYKMAVTDALSVALKALGVASDIYAGLWDGSKYRVTETAPAKKPKDKTPIQKLYDLALQVGIPEKDPALTNALIGYATESKLDWDKCKASTEDCRTAYKAIQQADKKFPPDSDRPLLLRVQEYHSRRGGK